MSNRPVSRKLSLLYAEFRRIIMPGICLYAPNEKNKDKSNSHTRDKIVASKMRICEISLVPWVEAERKLPAQNAMHRGASGPVHDPWRTDPQRSRATLGQLTQIRCGSRSVSCCHFIAGPTRADNEFVSGAYVLGQTARPFAPPSPPFLFSSLS